jgi:hypothetical protein
MTLRKNVIIAAISKYGTRLHARGYISKKVFEQNAINKNQNA